MTEPKTDHYEIDKDLLRSVTDEAEQAFWDVVVQHFPEAKTGDLSPWTSVRLTIAAQEAITEWTYFNVPSTASKGD